MPFFTFVSCATVLTHVNLFIRRYRCQAESGGALAQLGHGYVGSVEVQKNVAFIGGGGVLLLSDSRLDAHNLLITENEAEIGGGVFLRQSSRLSGDDVLVYLYNFFFLKTCEFLIHPRFLLVDKKQGHFGRGYGFGADILG